MLYYIGWGFHEAWQADLLFYMGMQTLHTLVIVCIAVYTNQ